MGNVSITNELSSRAERAALLHGAGADEALIDDGAIAANIASSHAPRFGKVLELIGTATLEDSLLCALDGGIVCMTGIVGNAWTLENFAPMDVIPTGVYLTSYTGGTEDFMRTPSRRALSGRPVRIMLHCSDKFSPVKKVNEV
jgi:NADPH:quinone reductase-like Zn-dependent oxidoreductase